MEQEDDDLMTPTRDYHVYRGLRWCHDGNQKEPEALDRLRVVYDPTTNRFFLSDPIEIEKHGEQTTDRTEWKDFILPQRRSPTKRQQDPAEQTASQPEEIYQDTHNNNSVDDKQSLETTSSANQQTSEKPPQHTCDTVKDSTATEKTTVTPLEESKNPTNEKRKEEDAIANTEKEETPTVASESTKEPSIANQEATKRIPWLRLEALVIRFMIIRRFVLKRKQKKTMATKSKSPQPETQDQDPPTRLEPASNQSQEAMDLTTTAAISKVHIPALRLDLRLQSKSPSRCSTSPKKRRIRNYQTHFAQANANMNPAITTVDHHIKWNGEPIHVHVVTAFPQKADGSQPRPPTCVRTESLQNVFEFQALRRIRATPDGLRHRVNQQCSFTSLTSSSSSSSSEEDAPILPEPLSSDEDLNLPVFSRGDHVLFHARRRRFRGIVLRRIRRSCFYDLQAENGSVMMAIPASCMRLAPVPRPPKPLSPLSIGDRVLWTPPRCHEGDSSEEDEAEEEERLTYKARVVQRRAGNRYDVELRTGRRIRKVPRTQLNAIGK